MNKHGLSPYIPLGETRLNRCSAMKINNKIRIHFLIGKACIMPHLPTHPQILESLHWSFTFYCDVWSFTFNCVVELQDLPTVCKM